MKGATKREEVKLLSPGIHYGVPFDAYRADPGINQSLLKAFGKAKSPAHYIYERDHPKDEPKHSKIGRYVDSMLFTKTGPVVTGDERASDEFETALACKLHVMFNNDANKILMACQYQAVVIIDSDYDSETGGVPRLKGLIDLLPDPAKCDPLLLDYAFDLKTAADASPEGFRDACSKFGYHVQAAYYGDLAESAGRKITTFGFIVVETKPPHCVAIHYMPMDSHEIRRGRELYQRWLKDYSACLEKNQWPGYGEAWTEIRFKPWQLRDEWETQRME